MEPVISSSPVSTTTSTSSSSFSLRPAVKDDTDALVSLGIATGLFSNEEADLLLRSSLDNIFNGTDDPDTHIARVIVDSTSTLSAISSAPPLGWTYIVADPSNPAVWELYWIGVLPDTQRKGLGSLLLQDTETIVKNKNGRMLLISTSSTDVTSKSRQFYIRQGYKEVGRIPDYYAPKDDKVIFWKGLE